MKHTTIEQSPEPGAEAAFWREMGWHFCYVRGMKRFVSSGKRPYRAKVLALLMDAPRMECVPRDYIELSEAERAWGQSLTSFAEGVWLKHGKQNSKFMQVVILRGQPAVVLRESMLFREFGVPKWVSIQQVMEETKRGYNCIYQRLRSSSCRSKLVRRWCGGFYCVYRKEDVEEERQIWRAHGHCSNAARSGRRLKEYDENDELARSQWRVNRLIS